MPERNFCADAKCKALCCQNMKLDNVSKGELSTAFPDAKEIEGSVTSRQLLEKGTGVYAIYNEENFEGREYDVYIIGECPNLESDFTCGIHEERPNSCRNFQIGNSKCNKRRLLFNLDAVDPQITKEVARIQRLSDLQDFSNNL